VSVRTRAFSRTVCTVLLALPAVSTTCCAAAPFGPTISACSFWTRPMRCSLVDSRTRSMTSSSCCPPSCRCQFWSFCAHPKRTAYHASRHVFCCCTLCTVMLVCISPTSCGGGEPQSVCQQATALSGITESVKPACFLAVVGTKYHIWIPSCLLQSRHSF
jgi:hypothetical protein